MHHRFLSASAQGVWACMAVAVVLVACCSRSSLASSTVQQHEPHKQHRHQHRRSSSSSSSGGTTDTGSSSTNDLVDIPDFENPQHQKQHFMSRHRITKRSFFDIQCKGVYDKSIFAKLDRICEDCYNLFREPSLHSLCRKNCFTTDYFKGCVETLQLTDEIEQIQMWIKLIHGAEPGLGD